MRPSDAIETPRTSGTRDSTVDLAKVGALGSCRASFIPVAESASDKRLVAASHFNCSALLPQTAHQLLRHRVF